MNERIKDIRTHFGMTRAAFGEALGISADQVNSAERGRVAPTEMLIKMICKTFGVREEWLREGEGECFVPAPTNTAALSLICSKYETSPAIKALIDTYSELPEEGQAALEAFVLALIAKRKPPVE